MASFVCDGEASLVGWVRTVNEDRALTAKSDQAAAERTIRVLAAEGGPVSRAPIRNMMHVQFRYPHDVERQSVSNSAFNITWIPTQLSRHCTPKSRGF
jgi:hypothetical protein